MPGTWSRYWRAASRGLGLDYSLGDRVTLVDEPYAAAEGADALFLVTEWNEFRSPDYARLREIMRGNVLFDGRNVWDAGKARAAGFVYHGVGRAGTPG